LDSAVEEVLNLAAAGAQKKAGINCYGLKKDSSEQVVLFWYQNRDRSGLLCYDETALLPDLMRYRRSDVALVEVAAWLGKRMWPGRGKCA
jgi:hypothetical protein